MWVGGRIRERLRRGHGGWNASVCPGSRWPDSATARVSTATFHSRQRKHRDVTANEVTAWSRPAGAVAHFDPVDVVSRQALTLRFAGGAVMELPEDREDLLTAAGRAWPHKGGRSEMKTEEAKRLKTVEEKAVSSPKKRGCCLSGSFPPGCPLRKCRRPI